jgi:hypothetical protein
MSSTQQAQQGTKAENTAPWSAQAPYLSQAFQQATGAEQLAQQNGAANAPSAFTAQYSQPMLDAFRQQLGYGTTNGSIPGSSAAAGSDLTGAGANAASSGLYGLAGFQPQGGTQSNIDAATAYSNNPAISGMVDASMRDAVRNANEVVMPGMARASAASGNINNSNNAVQQGILERGLGDKAADISSNLRGNAYQSGLGLAEQNSEAQNQNLLAKMTGLVSGGNTSVGTGVNANTGAVGQAGGLFGIANEGSKGLLGGEQAGLDNQKQAYSFGVNSPFDALNNYYGIVGNRAWGSNSTGTSTQNTTNTPSTLDTVGKIMGLGGALLGW